MRRPAPWPARGTRAPVQKRPQRGRFLFRGGPPGWATMPRMRSHALRAALVLLVATMPWPAQAQEPRTVYRCPGPPVLYTDAISAEEARSRNCRTIDGATVTVVQAPRRPAPAAASAPASPPAARPPGETRIDPAAQRARDTDARRILQEELQREEQRLAEMRAEFNNGEPERRGDERNFARYQERVAEMRAAIQRKEADIAALKRELAKLAPS